MFLTAETLAPYLISRGVLSTRDVIEGRFSTIEAGRRNRNFKVYRGDQVGLFVKQVPLRHEEVIGSLRQEATILRLARDTPQFATVKALAPTLRDYDSARHALVTDLIMGAQDMGALMRGTTTSPTNGWINSAPSDFRLDLATALGRIVASYHLAAPEMFADQKIAASFPRQPPWALTVERRLRSGELLSSFAPSALTSMLAQCPELLAGCGRAVADWRPVCLVHGDLKWDNVMVSSPVAGEAPTLRLIDWELSDIGDPAWDIACMFYGYVVWAFVALSGIGGPAAAPGSLSRDSLERQQAAVRAFWNSYTESAGFAEPRLRRELLLRVVTLFAFRCVQGAFELSFNLPQASMSSIAALQAARNSLTAPEQMAMELIGLAPP